MDELARGSETDPLFRESQSLVSPWKMHRREVNLIHIVEIPYSNQGLTSSPNWLRKGFTTPKGPSRKPAEIDTNCLSKKRR